MNLSLSEIQQELKQVLVNIFQVSAGTISTKTTSDDVEKWD